MRHLRPWSPARPLGAKRSGHPPRVASRASRMRGGPRIRAGRAARWRMASGVAAPARAWPYVVALLVGLSPLLASPSAHAAPEPLWEVGLGVGWARFDEYAGTDQSRSLPLAYPHIIYRGRLNVGRSGMRGMLFDEGAWRAYLGFGGNVLVDSSRHHARRCLAPDTDAPAVCMPNLPWVVQTGPVLEYTPFRGPEHSLRVRLQTLFATAVPLSSAEGPDSSVRSVGWVVSPRVDYRLEKRSGRNRLRFSTGMGVIYQSQKFNHFYYGVDPEYAVDGLRDAYQPSSGLAGWRLSSSLSYQTRDWILVGYARYRALDGDVFRDSPLVERRHSVNAGFSVARVLWRSERTTSRWQDVDQ